MSEEFRYTRLPGRSPLINPMRSSLWLGDDHLLLVSHSFVAENYRRFPLHAVQAIVSTQTRRGRTYNIVFACIGALQLLAMALWSLKSFSLAMISGMPLLFTLLLVLINVRRGPTCRTILRTAVQTVDLGSLSRLRAARRVTAMLVNSIEAAQGFVPSERLSELSAQSLSGNAVGQQVAPIVPVVSRRAEVAAPVPTYCRGRAHSVLFSMVIGVGCCSLAGLLPGVFSLVSVLSLILLLLIFGTGIGAGIAQIGSTMPTRLKVFAWLSPGYHIVTFVATVVAAIIYAVIHFSDGGTQGLTDHIAYRLFALFDFAVSAMIGAFGLVWLGRYRREHGPRKADSDDSHD
jgi:hypothetical protein